MCREKSLLYHPDKQKTESKFAQDMFQLVKLARDTLCDAGMQPSLLIILNHPPYH